MYTEHQSWPELFLAVRRVSSSTSRKVFLRIATAAMLRGLHLIFLGKVLQKCIDGLIPTHKVVTADDISGRFGKL